MKRLFWKNKRVFLTGHTGFKGGWLSLWLQRMGAQVTGYALESPSQPNLFEVASVSDGMHSIIGDVRDSERLAAALKEAQPEIVIHMAAQPLVRESYREPVETFDVNVMGTVNLLEALRSLDDVRVVLNVTTDKIYENRESLWGYRENEPLGGSDPYAASKACSELVSRAYHQSFLQARGVALATARAGNVVGGGDWAGERLVPDLIRAFMSNAPVEIRYPNAIRPWQHVLEPLHGYLLLAERLYETPEVYCEPWNFGPPDEQMQPVRWIAERMKAQWGADSPIVISDAPQPHETGVLRLDASKARQRLGWQSALDLEESLQWIASWYQAYAAGQEMRALTERQIAAYESRFSEEPVGV